MKLIEFECRNCGNEVYRRSWENKRAIIGTARSIQKEIDCCEEPDYSDNKGVMRHMKESSVAQLY